MSATLFMQSVLGGALTGGLYGLLAIGLSLSWGLLRLVNISHFALAFLGAYITYQLGTSINLSPWWSALIIVPSFFIVGVGLHWIFLRFKVKEMASMLVTFGIAMFVESMIQYIWSADFRKFESGYGDVSFRLGPNVRALARSAGMRCGRVTRVRDVGVAALHVRRQSVASERRGPGDGRRIRHRSSPVVVPLGRHLRGIRSGVAGVFIALISTLAPSEIGTWIGVVFAVVIIGGLGNPFGAMLAGMLIGVSESITMAAVNPAWAPLVSFTILIALLIGNPKWQ